MVQSTIGRNREKLHVRLRRFLERVASFRNMVGDIHDMFFQTEETNLSKESVREAIRRREIARKYWWLDGGGLGG
jgi:hypothetical protein